MPTKQKLLVYTQKEVDIIRFDDLGYVWVKCEEWIEGVAVTVEFFDSIPEENRGTVLLNIPSDSMYYAFSEEFLKNNYFKGYQISMCSDDVFDSLEALESGKIDQIFVDMLGDDGYLYRNGVPALRSTTLVFWESDFCNLSKMLKDLEKHPKISEIRISEVEYYNVNLCGQNMIKCLYMPDEKEFEKWQSFGEFWSCDCDTRAKESLKEVTDKYKNQGDPV